MGSYFDELKGESVVKHYESIECKMLMLKIYFWKFVNCLTEMKFHGIIFCQIFLIVLIICMVKKVVLKQNSF